MPPDFGYMEEGKLGKAYDLKLMARLGAFLKPYGLLIGLSLVLVLLMAALDLVVPYLTKEAIDRYIVVSAREVVLKRGDSADEKRIVGQYGKSFIPMREAGRFLVPPGGVSIDRPERGDLFSEVRPPDRESLLPLRPPKPEGGGDREEPSFCFREGRGRLVHFFRSDERVE